MSSRFHAAATRSGINTADSAYFQLRLTATTSRIELLEIKVGISVAPTTAPLLYLARSTAVGTSTATLAGQPTDPNVPSPVGTLDSTWSTPPTFSTSNLMDIGPLAVTAGGAWVWAYDPPLLIPASTSVGLVIANKNASGATTGTFAAMAKWDE